MKIEKFIPVGKENAISRTDLCNACGLADRAMREQIEKARKNGVVICCMQDGTGYYIADTVEDLVRQYKQDYARAMSLLVRLKPVRRELVAKGLIVHGKLKNPLDAKDRHDAHEDSFRTLTDMELDQLADEIERS